MSSEHTFVIVGGGLAGAKAAQTLRQEGFDGRVVLLGEESHVPYERPPLSKSHLRGETSAEEAFVQAPRFYEDNDVELRLGRSVQSVDVRHRRLGFGGGEELAYQKLLLATGAEPRKLSVPGSDLPLVHYLRTLHDSERLAAKLGSGRRLVVIGAGWIGSEVAASARQMGTDVAMVEVGALPLERVLGAEVASFYRDLHAGKGVDLHFGVGVTEIRGGSDEAEVVLNDGTRLGADAILVGIGVMPRDELARLNGLGVDNGVITDEYLATTDPDVYAAGDVANSWHPVLGRRVRLEHWSSALNQGPVAALNMMGRTTPYEKLPYFFSDQYDVGMEYTGLASGWEQVVIRGDRASGEFIAFWLQGGRVQAGMNVNIWDQTETIGRLIGADVDADRLGDPSIGLDALVPVGSEAGRR